MNRPIIDGCYLIVQPVMHNQRVIGQSIWLCQGFYDHVADEYATQYHISEDELDTYIKVLQDVRDKLKEKKNSGEQS